MTELTIDQALQQAIESHKAGQVKEADRLYTAILKAQPKHPDANHNMGVLAVGFGKVEQALPFFQTALEANPAKAQFWLSYIDALIKLGELAEAKAVLDQAKSKGAKGDGFDKLEHQLNETGEEHAVASKLTAEVPPQQPNILDSLKLDQALKLAKKKAKEGSSEEAKRIYQDILTKFSKNKRARDGLKGLTGKTFGKASKVQDPPQQQLQLLINLYSQGQLQQALKQAGILVQQFPQSAILFNIQGAVLKGLGQLDASVEAYNKALAIKPDYAEACYNMGGTLKQQGKLEEAIEAYKKALAIEPNYAEAYNNMGIAIKDQGKLGEAIEAYNKALAIKPDNAAAYYNVGNAFKDQSKLEEAIEAYNKALALKPDYAAAYYNMGNALKEQGKLEEAILAYNKALAIKPDYAEAYSNMGITLREQGKLEEAIEAYNKALALKPDYAEACYNMGGTLKQQGKLEEAIEAYNKALAIKPNYAEAYNNMGIAIKDQGKLEEAIEAYNKALAIKPDNAEAYNNMGVTLQEQGELEDAIRAYNKALAIKPDNAETVENSQSLAVQLLPIIANYEFNFDTSAAQANSEIVLRPKYQIQNAIKAYLEIDFGKAHSHNKNFKACDQKRVSRLEPKDKVFCNAYSNFIEKLLEANWDEEPAAKNKIYHLGESHCLSYAHRVITMGGSNFKITPRITFGAKAFHFSRTKYDRFKAITKAHFVSLPKNSKVFLSYGEIDCRPNEGFVTASRKLDKPLEELIDQTASGYVQWFLDQNTDQRHRIYFINVPAPVYQEKLSADLNSETAKNVVLFNAALKKYSLQHGFDTVDVFKFTAGKEGFSNGRYHIDNRHLGVKALTHIERQFF